MSLGGGDLIARNLKPKVSVKNCKDKPMQTKTTTEKKRASSH